MNSAAAINNGIPGFYAHTLPDTSIIKLNGKDVATFVFGCIIGIIALLGLMWYRGGFEGPEITSITSIFDTNNSNTSRQDGTILTDSPVRIGQGPAFDTLRVKVDKLTLRRCAGFDCGAITILSKGAVVNLLGDREFANDMYWVKVRVGNQDGWLSRYYLE